MAELCEKEFWNWMSYEKCEGGSRVNGFWGTFNELFSGGNEFIDRDFIVAERVKNHVFNKDNQLENLSKAMPQKYFNEIQYCLMMYTAAFNKIFPQLANQVDLLAYIEWLLYMDSENPWYRDHLVHMFKVAYVGNEILEESTSFKENIIKKQFESDHFSKWVAEHSMFYDIGAIGKEKKSLILSRAFLLAAIFHDFGYGYYFLSKYKKKMNCLRLPGSDFLGINSDMEKIILNSLVSEFVRENHWWLAEQKSEFKKNVGDQLVIGFFRDCIGINHSVASCLCVLQIAESLKKSRAIDQEIYLSFQIAAEAIMLHDMNKTNKKWCHLRNEKGFFIESSRHKDVPVSVLLIVADELAVFGRKRLKREVCDNKVILHYPAKIDFCINLKFSNDTFSIKENNGSKDLINAFKDHPFFFEKGKENDKRFFDYIFKVE